MLTDLAFLLGQIAQQNFHQNKNEDSQCLVPFPSHKYIYIYISYLSCVYIYIYLSFFNPISSKKSKKNIPSFTRVRVPSLLQWSKDLPRSVSWADPDLGRTSSFNPFEKYSSFWIISPNFRGENKTNVWNHHHQSKIENVQPYQVCSGQVSKQACAIPKSAKPVLRASVELV